MDGKLAKVRFATFCKFVLRGPPPRRTAPSLAFVRWLASRRVVRSSAVRSFFVGSSAFARSKKMEKGNLFLRRRPTGGWHRRGEERRRRRGGGGCGGGGAFPLFPWSWELLSLRALSLSRSHTAAGRLSDPVLKIDGGSMQLSFSLPRLDDRLLSLSSSSSFARRTRNR